MHYVGWRVKMIGVSYEKIRTLVRQYDLLEREVVTSEMMKEIHGKEIAVDGPSISELQEELQRVDDLIQLELDYLALHRTTSS